MDPREIDALVAEKVMGWKVHHRNTAYYVPSEYQSMLMPDSAVGVDEFRPSRSIESAWEVVEHIRTLPGFRFFQIGCVQADLAPDPWEAAITLKTTHIVYADTAPMAICLAALRAVGVEVKEK